MVQEFSILRTLSPRERFCVRISYLSATFSHKAARRIIRDALRRRSFSSSLVREIYIHLSLTLGYPSMLEGLATVPLRLRKRIESRREQPNGMSILRSIYGPQTTRLLRNLKAIHPELRDWIVRDVYGKVFSRSGLSLQEREIINVVVLAVQNLDRQLYSHLRGCLRVGVSQQTLSILAEFLLRVGPVKSPRVVRRLKEIVESKG